MKSILIIGDSLGLPRKDLSYKCTWPYLLSSKLKDFDFIIKLQRALTTRHLFEAPKQDWLEFYMPNTVIMQIGIVDCAPRYVKKYGLINKVLATIPSVLSQIIWKLIKRFRKRSVRYADVSLEDYHQNLVRFLGRCETINTEKVILIKIASPGPSFIKKNPNVPLQIRKYNEILDLLSKENDRVVLVDCLTEINQEFLCDDGYHLNEKGNSLLYNSLLSLFNNLQ